MSEDAPSPRTIWNVKVLINLLVLLAYFMLLGFGVFNGSLTVTDALGLLGSTALGGGLGWLSK